MKKLAAPDLGRELEAMYRRIGRRVATYGALTRADVEREIQRYRREKEEWRSSKCWRALYQESVLRPWTLEKCWAFRVTRV